MLDLNDSTKIRESADSTKPADADVDTIARVENGLTELERVVETGAQSGGGTDGEAAANQANGPLFSIPAAFKLSVVIPVFNERETIQQVLDRVQALPVDTEVIVVDDGSTDGTREILKPLAAWPTLKLICKDQNEGKGAALRSGFSIATGDVVVVQDADLEYDPGDILPLLEPIISNEADVVFGSRFLGDVPQDPSFLHRFGNGLLTRASNLFTGLKLTDMETCHKAFRRSVLRTVTIRQKRFGFEPEVTAKIARRRYRIAELPVSYHARGYEEGKKIGFRDAINALYCIVRYGLAD